MRASLLGLLALANTAAVVLLIVTILVCLINLAVVRSLRFEPAVVFGLGAAGLLLVAQAGSMLAASYRVYRRAQRPDWLPDGLIRALQHGIQPRLRHKLAAIPVAGLIGRRLDRTRVLTLARVTFYDDGFVITGDLSDPWISPEKRMKCAPEIVFTARDDRGGVYRVWPFDARGNAAAWHFDYRCAPAVHPAATALHLTVATLRWRFIFDKRADEEERAPSTWQFMIPLAGQQGT